MTCGACGGGPVVATVNVRKLVCAGCLAEIKKILRIYHGVRLGGRSYNEKNVSIRMVEAT